MGRRNEHSREEIRAMAIDAARAMIEEGGLSALSSRKVAAQIGYTVGTLYVVFENQQELILEVNGRTLDELHSFVNERSASPIPGQSPVSAFIRAYIEFAMTWTYRWGALFEHQLPHDQVYPEWYQRKRQRMFGLAENALRKMGGKHLNGDLQIAAQAIWAGVHGVCQLALRDRFADLQGDRVWGVATQLVDHYLAGLGLRDSVPMEHGMRLPDLDRA